MAMPQKVAFITGAGRRIGAEIARLLHDSGLRVILHCHQSLKEAEKLAADLNAKREDSAYVLQEDLANIAALKKLMTKAIDRWQRLDVLINNASQFFKTKLGEVTENEWDTL